VLWLGDSELVDDKKQATGRWAEIGWSLKGDQFGSIRDHKQL
jgi:hypothetical protein